MNPPPSSATLILVLAQAIELVGGLIIAAYAGVALLVLVRRRGNGIERARLLVATGALAGLNFKLAATLLKTIELHTWSQLGMFAFIFALRFLLKRVFQAEQRRIRARQRILAAGEIASHQPDRQSAWQTGT